MGRAIHLLFFWVGFEQCFFLISGSSLLQDNDVTVLYLYWTFTYVWRSKSSQQIFCSAVFFLLICRCFCILVGVASGLNRLGNVMFWYLWEVEDFHFNAVFCNCFLVVYMCMWTEVYTCTCSWKLQARLGCGSSAVHLTGWGRALTSRRRLLSKPGWWPVSAAPGLDCKWAPSWWLFTQTSGDWAQVLTLAQQAL